MGGSPRNRRERRIGEYQKTTDRPLGRSVMACPGPPLNTFLREKFMLLGKPSFKKSAVFFNIVQKAFDPPPLLFEHHVVNFLMMPPLIQWPE